MNSQDEFFPHLTPPDDATTAYWFAFHESRMLVAVEGETLAIPTGTSLDSLGLRAARTQYLGLLRGAPCYSAEIEGPDVPQGMAWQGLRTLFGRFDELLVGIASRASQIVDWDRTHQYCGRCGTPTLARTDERARACPSCRLTVYPRICPAMMVLITRGREVLLARKSTFPQGRYSALAGFVEAGESLEETIRREAFEEVGVQVGPIHYFGSQSWPFPNSLMVAFTAEYAGGEIRPDGVEIEDAQWFDAEALPTLPDRISISRWLIDTTTAELARRFPR